MRRILGVAAVVLFAAAAYAVWPQTLGGRIAYVMVAGHSMEPTMHYGDVAVIGAEPEYHVGDIIAYHVPAHEVGGGAEVIHRIVGGDAHTGFTTRGDNNSYNDPWTPHPADIVGARWALIPHAGTLFSRLQGPAPLAAFSSLIAVIAAFPFTARKRRRATATAGGGEPPGELHTASETIHPHPERDLLHSQQ